MIIGKRKNKISNSYNNKRKYRISLYKSLIKKGKKKFIFSNPIYSGFIIKDILKYYPITLSTVLMKKTLCLKYRKFSENYNIISDFI